MIGDGGGVGDGGGGGVGGAGGGVGGGGVGVRLDLFDPSDDGGGEGVRFDSSLPFPLDMEDEGVGSIDLVDDKAILSDRTSFGDL